MMVHLVESHNIILFHSRKAGGTTAFRWLEEFNKLFNDTLNIIRIEAYPFVHRGDQNIIKTTIQKYKTNALYVLTLRHPIDRILSQYDFEWKWGCLECDARDDLPQFNLTYRNFMTPMRFNQRDAFRFKYSNIALHDFLDRVEEFEMNNKDLSYHRAELMKEWILPYALYLRNYYLWFFCCNDEYCNLGKREWECLEAAKIMIDAMDLILITEWMNDIRTQLHFNRVIVKYVMGKNGTYDLIQPPSVLTYFRRPYARNRMISKQDYHRLLDWNAMDLKLYQYAERKAYTNIMN